MPVNIYAPSTVFTSSSTPVTLTQPLNTFMPLKRRSVRSSVPESEVQPSKANSYSAVTPPRSMSLSFAQP